MTLPRRKLELYPNRNELFAARLVVLRDGSSRPSLRVFAPASTFATLQPRPHMVVDVQHQVRFGKNAHHRHRRHLKDIVTGTAVSHFI